MSEQNGERAERFIARRKPVVFQFPGASELEARRAADSLSLLAKRERTFQQWLPRALVHRPSDDAKAILQDLRKARDRASKILQDKLSQAQRQRRSASKSGGAQRRQRSFQGDSQGDSDFQIIILPAMLELIAQLLQPRECPQLSGVVPSTGVGWDIDEDSVSDGSTTGGDVWYECPYYLSFEFWLNDVAKWYRWDNPDQATMIMEEEFTFPVTECDSELSWSFSIGAGTGVSIGADEGLVLLDYAVAEQPDASVPVPTVTIPLKGELVYANEERAWYGSPQIYNSGGFWVKKQTVSKLYVAYVVSLTALDGMVAACWGGIFHLYDPISWAYGVRYSTRPLQVSQFR